MTRKQRLELAQRAYNAPEKITNAEVLALAVEVLRTNMGRQFDPLKYPIDRRPRNDTRNPTRV